MSLTTVHNHTPIRGNNPYTRSIFEHTDLIWMEGKDQAVGFDDFTQTTKPLVLDLGCGAGNFLRDSAQKYTDEQFIGFELRYKRLVLAAQKMKKWGISNVRLAQVRAEHIHQWFEPKSLHRVHINFPDPWPKKKHRKNRLLQETFLRHLSGLIQDDGSLVFKTDHQEYFSSTLKLLEQTDHFQITELSWDLHNSTYQNEIIFTEFERIFLSQGLPVYHLKARPLTP